MGGKGGLWGILPPKHLKTTPNTTPKRLISLLFSWSGAPGPPQAPFWRPNGEKCGFWGILTPKHLKTTLFTPFTPFGVEIRPPLHWDFEWFSGLLWPLRFKQDIRKMVILGYKSLKKRQGFSVKPERSKSYQVLKNLATLLRI